MTLKLFDWVLGLFAGRGVLAGILALLGAMGAGYWAGDHQRNNAWLAKQAAVERKAHEAYQAEVARSNLAAQNFVAEYGSMQTNFSNLEGKFHDVLKRVPLVLYKQRAPERQQPGTATPGLRGQLDAQPDLAAADAPAEPAGLAGSLRLSLGAVWLWNSALTGADTPAGACNAADPTAAACALDAGLALDAAWENHVLNAQSCALDRLRHQRLIDYIEAYLAAQLKAVNQP